MNGQDFERITINSRKFDGTIRRSWACSLITKRKNRLLFVGKFDFDISHPELGQIQRGTISYEYYWLDRWYNIFCFYEPDGTFRNYYCNLSMPPVFKDNVFDYVDLDIDVVVWPDWTFNVLDQSEFEENAAKFAYPAQVREAAAAALDTVLELIELRRLPRHKQLMQQTQI